MVFMMAYLTFHAFQGEYSLPALKRLQEQEVSLLAEAGRMHNERLQMERKIALLREKSLDPDMLEEQVRKRLGFAHPDEVIIFLD